MPNKTQDVLGEIQEVVTGGMKDFDARLREMEAKAARPPMDFGGTEGAEERKAFVAHLRRKGLDATTAANGAVLVPESLDKQITAQAATWNPIAGLVRRVATASASFSIPVATALPAIGHSSDTGTRSATTAPSFALVKPPSGELYANVPLTNHLLDDAGFDLWAWVVAQAGAQIGVNEAADVTNGDGTDKCKGFTTYTMSSSATPAFGSVGYQPSGSASAITADGLISLAYSLPARYRAAGKAAWVMSTSALAAARQLKASGSGDYLWAPGIGGTPSTFLGFPVHESADLPAVAANAYPVWFGNWEAFYTMIDIASPRVIVDPYTTKGTTTLYYAKRTGGAVVDSAAVRALKVSTT